MASEKLIVQVKCHMCRKVHEVTVNAAAFMRWENREGHIQDLMPELSASERELLISQTCSRCFDSLFGGGE